jgi:hypothetical protein
MGNFEIDGEETAHRDGAGPQNTESHRLLGIHGIPGIHLRTGILPLRPRQGGAAGAAGRAPLAGRRPGADSLPPKAHNLAIVHCRLCLRCVSVFIVCRVLVLM